MSITDIFWLFIMLSAVQPVLRQQMLNAMRTRKLARLETERNSRVILLVHRQETMRLLGFPIARYIDINDSEDVLRGDPDDGCGGATRHRVAHARRSRAGRDADCQSYQRP
jgi:ClpP class serine protease